MSGFEGVTKRGPEQGRIVITLECTIPRDDWPKYTRGAVGDAVDALRQRVANYEMGCGNLADLMSHDSIDSIHVVAIK